MPPTHCLHTRYKRAVFRAPLRVPQPPAPLLPHPHTALLPNPPPSCPSRKAPVPHAPAPCCCPVRVPTPSLRLTHCSNHQLVLPDATWLGDCGQREFLNSAAHENLQESLNRNRTNAQAPLPWNKEVTSLGCTWTRGVCRELGGDAAALSVLPEDQALSLSQRLSDYRHRFFTPPFLTSSLPCCPKTHTSLLVFCFVFVWFFVLFCFGCATGHVGS